MTSRTPWAAQSEDFIITASLLHLSLIIVRVLPPKGFRFIVVSADPENPRCWPFMPSAHSRYPHEEDCLT